MESSNSTTIVIFGASGDLTKRKLIPALFQLKREKLLPGDTRIVGFARRKKTNEEFRSEMNKALVEFSRSKPSQDSDEIQELTEKPGWALIGKARTQPPS